MPTYVPSTGATVTHSAEYVEEGLPASGNYGVFPTNPTMKWFGADLQYDDSPNMNPIKLGNLGSEDLAYILGGKQIYTVSLDFAIQSSAPLKYGINSQGTGTGSIDESLSLLISVKVNGTTNYLKITGARPDTTTIKWASGKETRATMGFIAQQIPAYVTSDPVGTGTHATDPGTNPWTFADPGAGGLTIGATVYDFIDASFTAKRNLSAIYPIGYAQAQYIPPLTRDLTGDFTLMTESTTPYDTYLIPQALQTIVFPLKAGTSVLTLSNCSLEKVSRTIQVKDVLYDKFSFTAQTAALT